MSDKDFHKLMISFNNCFGINNRTERINRIIEREYLKGEIQFKFLIKSMEYYVFNYNNWSSFSPRDIINRAKEYQRESEICLKEKSSKGRSKNFKVSLKATMV